jgi:molybdopterin-guanine dinucleotide biosynthesis protein B
MPKLEIWRKENGKPLLHPQDEHVVAIAADAAVETRLPRFDLNDYDAICDFILSYNGFK